jgi:signal peptidase II
MSTDEFRLIALQHPTSTTRPPRQGVALPIILGLAMLVFGLDQLTKYWVVQYIPLYESWTFFPALAKLFKFTYITNTGAAFGMFPQLGNMFMIVAIGVIVAIVMFYRHLPTANFWVRLSLGLQLGGALGNLVDRITRGFVVDFIDIGFWPIFNLADLAIVLGVTILAYYLWNEENSADAADNSANLAQGEKV